MPTYEYVCDKCGHTFDLFQSITAEPLTVCPQEQCARKRWGRGRVRRAIGGGAGLLFKGSGFYITDYRSDGYKAAAKKEGGSAAPSESKPATPKPDASPSAKPTTPTGGSTSKPS